MQTELNISELTSDEAIAAAYGLMNVLRPHLRAEAFIQQVRAQQRDGYRMIGGFKKEILVALAGFRFSLTLSRGHHLFVDDLITAPNEQGNGHGTAMLRHLAALARKRPVSQIWLDSRDTARTYYEKVGFSVHTSMPCCIDASRL